MEPAPARVRTSRRIDHWLDHARSELWFVASAPPPSAPDEDMDCDTMWSVLAPTATTLRHLAFEHGDELCRESADMLLAVLETCRGDGPATARALSRRYAAELSVLLDTREGAV